MGDIFFFIKMIIFTVVLVFLLQIKVGDTTLEEKVIAWTHQSEFSEVIQEVADSAVHIIGVGYNRVRGDIKTKFAKEHADEQIPGNRLKSTIESSKTFIKETFEGKETSPENEN